MSIKIVSRLESFSEGKEDVEREIMRAFRLQQRGDDVSLAFTVTFKGGTPWVGDTGVLERQVNLFRDRGIRPVQVVITMRKEGGLEPALREYVRRRTGVWHPEPIDRIELHMFPTP